MRTEGKILRRVDRITQERRDLWKEGGDPIRSAEIARELTELYAELRLVRARRRSGPPEGIVKRARVERELEKLYS